MSYKALREATKIFSQLSGMLDTMGIRGDPLPYEGDPRDLVLKSLVAGFFFNLGIRLKTGELQSLKGKQPISVHPSSNYDPKSRKDPFVVFNETALTSKTFCRNVSGVSRDCVLQAAPGFVTFSLIKKKSPKQVKEDP